MERRYLDHLATWLLTAALLVAACEQPPASAPRPTSPAEAQRIAQALTRMVGPPAGGWAMTRTPSGATRLDLRGRFQDVVVAGHGPDGSLRTTCVSTPEDAARFLSPVPAGGR